MFLKLNQQKKNQQISCNPDSNMEEKEWKKM